MIQIFSVEEHILHKDLNIQNIIHIKIQQTQEYYKCFTAQCW
jgi:hypothetical protein